MLDTTTITDAQIRELLESSVKERSEMRIAHAERLREVEEAILMASWASGESKYIAGIDARIPYGHEARYMREGRARCAAILNARAAKAGGK